MKRIKMLLYTAAFGIALSASFAFRPSSVKTITAYLPNATPFCTQTTLCDVGNNLCIVGGVQAYLDKGICTKMAKKP